MLPAQPMFLPIVISLKLLKYKKYVSEKTTVAFEEFVVHSLEWERSQDAKAV